MELVVEAERLLTLYDTLPTTNEIVPGSTPVHCSHYVVLPWTIPPGEQESTQLPVDQLLRLKMRPPQEGRGQC